MDKGISQVESANRIEVNEMTIVNWELKGKVPRIKYLRGELVRTIPGMKCFYSVVVPSHNKPNLPL